MLSQIANFIHGRFDPGRPLLLGYSGGPDSKALLYALLEIGCLGLHVAHVDHGWREESAEEGLELKEETGRLGLPFHTIRLAPGEMGSQEARAREERLKFFRSLFEQIPFQALLLAHQAGDVAETVLKRLLEGAHLANLGGLRPISAWEGMPIWRPLLSVGRLEILSFLKERGLQPLFDPTNADRTYLRARMREETIPLLEKSFGKAVADNLCVLSHRSCELKDYLDRKAARHIPMQGPWGSFHDLSQWERIEARHLLQKEAYAKGIALSRASLEMALDACFSKRPNCRIAPRIFVDRGLVFLLSAALPQWREEELVVAPGTFHVGDWQVGISPFCKEIPSANWQSVWSGRFSILAPLGSRIAPPPSGRPLRHLWNCKKVPAFFRPLMPVLWKNGVVIKEFLSGHHISKRPLTVSNYEPFFEVSFSTHLLSGFYSECSEADRQINAFLL